MRASPAEISQQVLDSLTESRTVIGFDWTCLYVNGAAARLGLQKRKNLLGRTMPEMDPGVEGSTIFIHQRQCMKERVHRRFEARLTFVDEG